MKVTLDMSLRNEELYSGCEIEEVGGRKNLLTPPDQAANIIGRNAHEILSKIPRCDKDICILTGPMAIWAYLVVFHAVVHSFVRVYYYDGRNDPVLLSAHGALRHPEEVQNLLEIFSNNYLIYNNNNNMAELIVQLFAMVFFTLFGIATFEVFLS